MPAEPPQLQLARRWVSELGDPIHETPDISDQDGVHIPSFGLTHGPVRLAIVAVRGSISVAALIQFPEELTQAARSLPSPLQARMLEALKACYLEYPRAAWTLFPTTAMRLGEVERIQLSEILRIQDGDANSFNRLVDAIQELTSLFVRSNQLIAGLFTGKAGLDSAPQDHRPGYG